MESVKCDFCDRPHNHSWRNHHESCPYYWHGDREPTVVVRLNEYQAANLLRLLKDAWASRIQVEGEGFLPYHGDWCGEIPLQLEAKMRAAGGGFVTTTANDGQNPLEAD